MSVKHFLKMMSLALVLLLGSAQLASAQNITLNFDRTPLKTVLNEIQKQVDYTFVYNDQQVGADKPVTIHVHNAGLTAVLDQMLKPLNINYKILDKQIALSPAATTAQQQGQSGRGGAIVLKGRITDQDGMPVAGAAVQNLTEKTYAITDVDGNYTLAVKNPRTANIEVTFLGMDTVTEPLNGRSNFDVQMTYSRMFIEGAVVTGYQEIQQKKVTGSIATVNSKNLEERFTLNVMDNLEGRVAGLSTYGGKLTIRGVSSMYGNTSPLLVVDGLPVETDIDDLNPYDIESVNVLKDASAAAIYGARASNGIIVITTKSAREKGKVDVDFSTNLIAYERKNVDYAYNFYMTPEQQIKMERDYWQWRFFESPDHESDVSSSMQGFMAGTAYVSPIHYAYYKLAVGETSMSDVDALCNKLARNNFAKEFADAVYMRRFIQDYNLALRNTSDHAQNNVVLNLKKDNGGVINSGLTSLNFSYKGSFELAKWLTANMSVNGIYNISREKGYDYNGFDNEFYYPAYESMYDDAGNMVDVYTWYNGNKYWNGGGEGARNAGINIVDEYYNNSVKTTRQYMRYHGDLLFRILPGLTANAQFIYEMDHRTRDWNVLEGSHVNNTLYNAFMTTDETGALTSYYPSTGGLRNTRNTDGNYWTGRGQLNYANKFGKHEIVALAGTEFRQTLYGGTQSLMLGYDDQLQTASTQTMDLAAMAALNYNSYYMNSGYYGFPTNQFAFGPYIESYMSPITEVRHRYASAYANFTYTYDDKYNVFGSYRVDYADVYGLNVKLRGRPLWSAGVAWNLNNEDFLRGIGWVNALKLRFSYGVTGNIYQGATSYMTARVEGLSRFGRLSYGTIESPANPNLKWEQTRTANVGIDYSFLENRFRGSLDYYHKRGLDLFSYKNLDPATGFSSMFMNSADMVNNGVEFILTADVFRERRRSDFGWTSTLTVGYNKNQITSVENDATTAWQLISTPYREGYPVSAMWSYRFAGINDAEGQQGETMWWGDGDTKVHHPSAQGVDVLTFSGQLDPKLSVGFDSRFSWNGLSLSFLMAAYTGHHMWALQEGETFGCFEGRPVPSYFLNAWTPENPTNTPGIGRYSSSSTSSTHKNGDIYVYDASFLKVRNIVLGYELPENWARKIKADRINLQFQVDNPNLHIYANKRGIDPETLGVRIPTNYTFGLHVNF